jgi:hypothetical protein
VTGLLPRGPPFGKSIDKESREKVKFLLFRQPGLSPNRSPAHRPVGNLNTIPSRLLAELEALTECSLKTGEFQ